MSANVETMFSGNNIVPWHREGTVVDGVLTAAEALTASGLNWKVDLVPVYAQGIGISVGNDGDSIPTYNPIAKANGVQRDSDGSVLGIVGDRYRVIQNADAFSFADSLIDSGDAKYETAGALNGGRKVWLSAKLPEGVTVAGEQIDEYLLLANTHDGSGACKVMFTPVRVVCQNTLNMAIGKASASHSIRHSGSLEGKMQEAREVLGLGFNYFGNFAEVGEQMANRKMGKVAFDNLLEKLIPAPKGKDGEEGNAKRADAKRDEIRAVYNGADNLNNIRGTAWGAYNAIAEFEDHVAGVRGGSEDARFERSVFAPSLKAKAAKLLIPA